MSESRDPTIQRRVNVVLDNDVHRQLRHESVNRNEPMAVIIETALKEHFSMVGHSANE